MTMSAQRSILVRGDIHQQPGCDPMDASPTQPSLPGLEPYVAVRSSELSAGSNALSREDRAIHDWYRFVLSFPPHLVRRYLDDFGLHEGQTVLDPFCGTGTTLIEAKLNGFVGVGLEAHPFSHFASSVKVDWGIDPEALMNDALAASHRVLSILKSQGIQDNRPFPPRVPEGSLLTLDANRAKLLIKDSISPIPLHKTLLLLDCLNEYGAARHFRHMRLALANALVSSIGNLHFGPEVGVGKVKPDSPVVAPWLDIVKRIATDVAHLGGHPYPQATVHLVDARRIEEVLEPRSVDAVITSPPYPNEKDYTRTTRLESVLLGFINSRQELRSYKKELVRSNTRGVYKDDDDDKWISQHPEILRIAEAIENRRQELGKTSGFERLYPRVTKLYFGGMARHLSGLRGVLRPGAHLAYVVGDQASYLRIMIRTGQILADIASELGYEVVRIDPFRKRFATATKQELREEVVVLRWNGGE